MPRQSKVTQKNQEADDRLASVLNVVQRARKPRVADIVEASAPGEEIDLADDDVADVQERLDSSPPLSSVTEITSETLAEITLYRIPLNRIEVGGINTRVIDEDSRDFRELVENIRQYGQLEAIWVGIEEDHFRLIAGERRYRALRTIGSETAIAKIVDAPPEDWPILMLVENLQRKDMSAWEEAKGYQMLLDRGLTMEVIGRRVGRTKGHVSTILKIARNPLIMAALEDGRISSMSLAREMAMLVDRTGQEVQAGIIARVLEHVGRRSPTIIELRKWIQVQLSETQSEDTAVAHRGRQVSRGTFLLNEEQRLAAINRKLSLLSSKEIEMLAQIYEEQAHRLRLVVTDGPNKTEE